MIIISNVTKTYPNGVCANRDISLTVGDGAVTGLVGPNGAGKTTLVQQILGVIRTDAGRITVDGRERDTSDVAYVPQFPALYPALSAVETVAAGLMYCGSAKRDAMRTAGETLERVGLGAKARQYAYTLSGGQKKLLSFACALAQGRKNLILDEVTSMVDIVTKQTVWRIIAEERDRGAAILLASHDISEIKEPCTSFAALKNGAVAFSGRPEDIPAELCHCKITVSDLERAVETLNSPDCRYELLGDRITILTDSLSRMLPLIDRVDKAASILSLNCEHPSLYEGILSLLKRDQEGSAS